VVALGCDAAGVLAFCCWAAGVVVFVVDVAGCLPGVKVFWANACEFAARARPLIRIVRVKGYRSMIKGGRRVYAVFHDKP
jgi:hypothetical protein